MNNLIKAILQIKRFKEAEIPTLKEGEIGWAYDTNKLFIGDVDEGNICIETDISHLISSINMNDETFEPDNGVITLPNLIKDTDVSVNRDYKDYTSGEYVDVNYRYHMLLYNDDNGSDLTIMLPDLATETHDTTGLNHNPKIAEVTVICDLSSMSPTVVPSIILGTSGNSGLLIKNSFDVALNTYIEFSFLFFFNTWIGGAIVYQ